MIKKEKYQSSKICEDLLKELALKIPAITQHDRQLLRQVANFFESNPEMKLQDKALVKVSPFQANEKQSQNRCQTIQKFLEQTANNFENHLRRQLTNQIKDIFQSQYVHLPERMSMLTKEKDFMTFCQKVFKFFQEKNKSQRRIKEEEKKMLNVFQKLCSQVNIYRCFPNHIQVLHQMLTDLRKETTNLQSMERQEVMELINLFAIVFYRKIQIEVFQIWTEFLKSLQAKNIAEMHRQMVFSMLNLPLNYYDSRGDHQFPKSFSPQVDFRGGAPYFQPIYGKGFGLNARQIYNQKEKGDEWLEKYHKNQWAVAFYGLSQPVSTSSTYINSEDELQRLLLLGSCRKNKLNSKAKRIQQQSAQSLRNDLKGPIFCSPLFTSELFIETKEYNSNQTKFRVLLQCRVRPSAIKCIQDGQRWIIDNPLDIRPYRIIVFFNSQVQTIKKLSGIANFYKIPFDRQSWQVQYRKYIAKARVNVKLQLKKMIANKQKLINLIKVSLEGHNDLEKLRTEGVRELSKLQLPNVTQINIRNNEIKDEGVQALCTNISFKSLKQIELNDNAISTTGVSYIINNKWSKQIDYKLDTVQTKDNGYAFQIGKSIPTIKHMITEDNNLDFKFIEKEEVKNFSHFMRSLDLLMNIPLEGRPEQIQIQSQNIYKKLMQQTEKFSIKQCQLTSAHMLLALRNCYNQFSEVVFNRKSNAKTKSSLSFILCGADEKRVKFQHLLTQTNWKFDDFVNNNSQLLKFQNWYKDFLSEYLEVEREDIIVHKVTKGSILVQASVNQNSVINNTQFFRKEKVKVIPFFKYFNLSPEDFDIQGNYNFPQNKQCDIQYRAGIVYFQPVFGTRYGIKVKGLYDSGNNDWISMDGVKGEWAMAFHAVKKPDEPPLDIFVSNKPTTLQSIMSGRQKGQMLKAGPRQYHQHEKAANKHNQIVETGIYCSPLFSQCLLSYADQCKVTHNCKMFHYHVMLQCRINPSNFKICSDKPKYWLVNQSKDIRPYGIILFTPEQKREIQKLHNAGSLYPPKGHLWSSIRPKYEQFRKKHNIKEESKQLKSKK